MTTTTAPVATSGLGVLRASSLYIASVLGSGILVLPALAASAAGPASLVGVAAVLLMSVPLAGAFAALAARHPDAGGVATFVRRALGATAARTAGYWFYFGVSMGIPIVGVLGAEYVIALLGADRGWVGVVALAILAPPFLANSFGVRVSGSVQFAVTAALLVLVIGVVALAAPATDAANFSPFAPHGWAPVGTVVSLFIWAFAGWEAVTHIAAEFRNPRRTIPIATAIAIIVVGAAYLALQVVTVGVLGDDAGTSRVPLVDLIAVTAPGAGPLLVAVVAGLVSIGVLNTYLAAFSKLGASLGRDGDLPRFLGSGAEPGGVPRRSLAVVGALTAVNFSLLVASNFDLTPFILVQTSSIVGVYALGMVAALRLLERFSLGWWFAATSVLLVAGLAVLAGPNLAIAAILAVAAIIVGIVQRRRMSRAR
ncbi:amino acid permease [Salinibacterium sp. ZJ454]|uniref:APC family permease n=1 Tax=Salinibacterium sp. ZJ454 TaxID=2708339 RepID=UPI001FBB3067|nr:amino acid permease [Salinibacterium sp. ZJ454]